MNRRWVLKTLLAGWPLSWLARGWGNQETSSVYQFETTDAGGIMLEEAPEVAPAAAAIFAREVTQIEDGCPLHYRVIKTGELIPAEEVMKVLDWKENMTPFRYVRLQSVPMPRINQSAWARINFRDGELEPVREYSLEEVKKLWPESEWVPAEVPLKADTVREMTWKMKHLPQGVEL